MVLTGWDWNLQQIKSSSRLERARTSPECYLDAISLFVLMTLKRRIECKMKERQTNSRKEPGRLKSYFNN
jgi:hypothetical protein